MIGLILLAAAHAADPVVSKQGDATIEAHVDLAAAPADVYALVADAAAVARIDGTTKVETKPDGTCVLVTTRVEHPIANATYVSRSCPDGELTIRSSLVSGDAMNEYETRWKVEPHDGGSRLHYRIHTVDSLPVPQFVVANAAAKGTTRMLTSLRDHFAGK